MPINNLMSFDFVTVPDLELIRNKYGSKYDGYSDYDMVSDVKAEYNTDFLPVIYHKIVSISITYLDFNINRVNESLFSVVTFNADTEEGIITRFIKFLDNKIPNIMGWNSKGFDIQVLNYRMLKYMIQSNVLHNTEGEFKYNNYINRYHERHIDVMDKIGCFSGRANSNLETICISLGLPGKFSFNRDLLFEEWLQGKQQKIDEYCQTDTLNVMIIYLKYLVISNSITLELYKVIEKFIRLRLIKSNKPHLIEFNTLWS
jgi:predicted PolB exonuclease-like 3'-5' exonuclease